MRTPPNHDAGSNADERARLVESVSVYLRFRAAWLSLGSLAGMERTSHVH